MTKDEYENQMQRLKVHFGARHFSDEFSRLAALEVCGLPKSWFERQIDVWIGHRKVMDPPKLDEFKGSRLAWEKTCLHNVSTDAVQKMSGTWTNTKSDVLKSEFGASTAMEAFEMARRKLKQTHGGER